MVDAEGRLIGGVEVFSETPSKLAPLEKAAEAEQFALIDPLTSVGSRRCTQTVLHQQGELFRREGDSFAVPLLALDDFKVVNDTHGPDARDAVLKAVGRTIVNNLRWFDFLGRWGGDESIAILTRADAARCCSLVRNCLADWPGRDQFCGP